MSKEQQCQAALEGAMSEDLMGWTQRERDCFKEGWKVASRTHASPVVAEGLANAFAIATAGPQPTDNVEDLRFALDELHAEFDKQNDAFQFTSMKLVEAEAKLAAAVPMPAAERSNLERERDLAISAARHEAENADMWRKRALGEEPMPANEAQAQLGRMRQAFHINMLRAYPEKSHAEISAEIDKACGLAAPVPASEAAILKSMRQSFQTTQITPRPSGLNSYEMVFAFPSIKAMHDAVDEWYKFLAVPAAPTDAQSVRDAAQPTVAPGKECA